MMTILYILLAVNIVICSYQLIRKKKRGKLKNKLELFGWIYIIIAATTLLVLGITNLGETHYLLHQVLMILLVIFPGVILLGYMAFSKIKRISIK